MHYIFSMLSIIFKLKKYVYGIKNDFKNQWSMVMHGGGIVWVTTTYLYQGLCFLQQ